MQRAYPCTATVVFLLGGGLGAPAWAGDRRASFFNRSGLTLRLLPDGSGPSQPRCRVRVTCHVLPTLTTIKLVLDGRDEAPSCVDLPPDTLMFLEFLPIPGQALAGTLGFEIVAEADDQAAARMVGTVAFRQAPTLAGQNALDLRVTLEAPFVINPLKDRPWQVVVRRVHPEHDAVAEATEAEAKLPKAKPGCIIL